jgi:hypothetical protein
LMVNAPRSSIEHLPGGRRCFKALIVGALGFSNIASQGAVVDVLH